MKRNLAAIFAVAMAAGLEVGCSSKGPDTGSGQSIPVSVTLIPSAVSVPPGRTVPVAVTVSRSGYSTDPVTVTASGLPSGVSASPLVIGGSTGTLRLTASLDAPATDSAAVSVTATAGGGFAAATLTLSVTPSRFSLAVTPPSIHISRSSSGTVTVTVSRENLPDVIEVTASGPPGVTADRLLLEGNRGNLVLHVDGDAPLGPSSVTVSGVSGSTRATAPLQLSIGRAGSVDGSFGDGGMAVTGLGTGASAATPIYVAVQEDGKIVVVGTRPRPACGLVCKGLAVARYNPNGTLDTSFLGPDAGAPPGVAILFEAPTFTHPPSAVATSDGGILVASSNAVNTLVRITSDGNADPSFNADGGRPDGHAAQSIAGVAVAAADEKILVAGSTPAPARFALARYNPDGTLDQTFGDGGILAEALDGVTLPTTTGASFTSEKAKVVGFATRGGLSQVAVVSFDITGPGSVDRSFNDGGQLLIQLGRGGGNSQAVAALDLQGNTIVVASARDNSTSGPQHYALVSFQPDGGVDPSFGMDGGVTRFFSPDGGTAQLFAAAKARDNKIVAAGFFRPSPTITQFLLLRYNSNGLPDESFGEPAGILLNVPNPSDPNSIRSNLNEFDSVAFQGVSLVAAGAVTPAGANRSFVVVRYLP